MPQRVLLTVDFVFRVEGVWFSQTGVGIMRPFHCAVWFLYSLYVEGQARSHESGRTGYPSPPRTRRSTFLPLCSEVLASAFVLDGFGPVAGAVCLPPMSKINAPLMALATAKHHELDQIHRARIKRDGSFVGSRVAADRFRRGPCDGRHGNRRSNHHQFLSHFAVPFKSFSLRLGGTPRPTSVSRSASLHDLPMAGLFVALATNDLQSD